MQPRDDRARPTSPAPNSAVPVGAPRADDTQPFQRVTLQQPVAHVAPPVAAELAGMLLPGEAVTFASAPHPIVLLRPVLGIVVIALLLAIALSWRSSVIVHGHHVLVPLLAGAARTVVSGIALLLALREVWSLLGRLGHYLGYRIVTTNRRIFVVEGLFGRRVNPLGNTALAGSSFWQGILGRRFGFGTLIVPSMAGGAIRDMRDPVRLYHEFQAVANGVDGDTWTPALRQTQIP
jgi:PH (Pleckstrin Homology) domain-containing protein